MKKHVIADPKPGELGLVCSCKQRFATQKMADAHAAEQNLIMANEAKAELEREAERVAPPADKPQEPSEPTKTATPDKEAASRRKARPDGSSCVTEGRKRRAREPDQPRGITTVSVQSYIRSAAVQERVEELLGKESGEFTTSLMTAVNTNMVLQDCEPSSIVTAALTAASLRLPINPNLGFAHLVPYNDGKSKTRKAQFQMGWKGFVQLAQRTGRYKAINVGDVRQGEYKGTNGLTGTIDFDWISDDAKRDKLPVVGFFELHDGFAKILYMTVDDLRAHAKKYSQSYRKGYGLWVDNFPVMAMKTVIKLLISKYGPMSTQIERALVADQAAVGDDSLDYVDNKEKKKTDEPEEGEIVTEAGDGK